MDLAPGTEVDRYTVQATIGRGGMATVYRVCHTQLGTTHALKVLTLPKGAVKRRMLLEGQVQARISHPNVVAVTDVVEVGGAPGLVMELVRGPSLDRVLNHLSDRLPLATVDALVPGILAGVAASHADGVVHRDLKPANILLSVERGTVVAKVSDFGLVKLLLGDEGSRMTHTGATMGTPAYMSPEQIRSATDVDARADVFALGALLYELVSGRAAYPGEGTWEVFDRVIRGDHQDLREVAPDLPDRVVDAIEGALAGDRDQRIRTCQALWARWRGDGAGPLAEAAAARPAFDPAFLAVLRDLEVPAAKRVGPAAAADPSGFATWKESAERPNDPPSPPRGARGSVLAVGASLGCGLAILVLASVAVLGVVGVWVGTREQPVVVSAPPDPPPVSAVPAVERPPAPSAEAPSPEDPSPETAPPAVPGPTAPRTVHRANPESAPAPTSGIFAVEGDADLVVLLPADGGPPRRPGPLDPGTYTVQATFGARVVRQGTVEIQAGTTARWRCAASLGNCAPAR